MVPSQGKSEKSQEEKEALIFSVKEALLELKQEQARLKEEGKKFAWEAAELNIDEAIGYEEASIFREMFEADTKEKFAQLQASFDSYKKKFFKSKKDFEESPRAVFGALMGRYLSSLYYLFKMENPDMKKIERYKKTLRIS